MNERIQELHKQAVAYALSVCDADGVYQGREYLQVIREKFAELIVKECIHAVEDTNDRYRKEYFANQIRNRFGVK